MQVVVVHYHELFLKGSNRSFFLSRLRRAILQALEDLGPSVRLEDNRLVVKVDYQADVPAAAERVKRLPGVAFLAIAEDCEPALEAIVDAGARLMASECFRTFRVRAQRARKSLGFRSTDIEIELGQRINDESARAGREAKVNLRNADATCYVEVTKERALIYTRKIEGPGGLPSGTGGRLVCLLSGGYDSAVAAYKMMRRGVRVTFVHFYGQAARPGEDSPPIVREIVRTLTRIQERSSLYLVPFATIQRKVVAYSPESYRILIYRRMMLRIAEKIAYKVRAQGLITGDSVSQVASQTLQNLRSVGVAVDLPIHRPLIGDDKREILDMAKKIGTYDLSSEPFADCCSLFMPRTPKIFANTSELDRAEAALEIPELVAEGVRERQKEVYEYRRGEVLLEPPRRPKEVVDESAAVAG